MEVEHLAVFEPALQVVVDSHRAAACGATRIEEVARLEREIAGGIADELVDGIEHIGRATGLDGLAIDVEVEVEALGAEKLLLLHPFSEHGRPVEALGQRGTEKLDPQSVPLDQRPLASKRAAECGTAGLQQSVIREIVLDEAAITLFAGSDEVPFLYGDYNYETIDDTDCLPAVAQYLVQHLLGYYNITRTFYSVPKHNGRSVTEKTRQVFIKRHHEDTPFDPQPTKKQKLF